MFFWNKRRKKKENEKDVIIHTNCYNKLPPSARQHFSPVPGTMHATPEVTHEFMYDHSGDYSTSGLAAIVGAELIDDDLNFIASSAFPGNDGFQGFDGGSGGGAGATGSWGDSGASLPDYTPVPSYDPSPGLDTQPVYESASYDSPSNTTSFDSGGSFDN